MVSSGEALKHHYPIRILGVSASHESEGFEPSRAQISWDDSITQKRHVGWVSTSNISKRPATAVGQEIVDRLFIDAGKFFETEQPKKNQR